MSSIVDNVVLTQKQKEILDSVYLPKWRAISVDCIPGDHKIAEQAVTELYALAGLPAPEFVWALNIKEGADLIAQRTREYYEKEGKAPKNIDSIVSDNKRSWLGGNFWSGYAAWVDFYNSEDIGKGHKLPTCYMEISKHCGYFFTLDKLCVITEKPLEVHLDGQNRLHNTAGMAVKYRSSVEPSGVWGKYAIHGIAVDKELIENPASLTVEEIESEFNAEVRRVLIDLYGMERYIQDANFEVLDEDIDPSGNPRQLLRKQQNNGDENIVRVKCLNSTPEPDGTIKTYFLPVHPQLLPVKTDAKGNAKIIPNARPQKMTCHNAVASTFGLYGHEYGLDGQVRQGDVLIRMVSGKAAKVPFRES